MNLYFTIRPLTKEEIAERYEAAKLKHAAKMQEVESNGDALIQGEVTVQEHSTSCQEITEPTQDEEHFIAFARVFSGTLKRGAKLYVLGPKYDPSSQVVTNDTVKLQQTDVAIR